VYAWPGVKSGMEGLAWKGRSGILRVRYACKEGWNGEKVEWIFDREAAVM
jgi:hypothetical protein